MRVNHFDRGQHAHLHAAFDKSNAQIKVFSIVAAVAVLLKALARYETRYVTQLASRPQGHVVVTAELSNPVILKAPQKPVMGIDHGVVHHVAVAAAVL